jgi:hypothetical protein
MIGLGVLAFGAVLGWWAVLIAGRSQLSRPALAGVTAAILAGGWIVSALTQGADLVRFACAAAAGSAAYAGILGILARRASGQRKGQA